MNHLETRTATSSPVHWPTSIPRPVTRSSSKGHESHPLITSTIDNSMTTGRIVSGSKKRLIRHHVRIPTFSRPSTPLEPSRKDSSVDFHLSLARSSLKMLTARAERSTALQLKSPSLTVPTSSGRGINALQNFPRETHEKRKCTDERKRRKQEARSLEEKHSQVENWFQLRRSLGELKRLSNITHSLSHSTTSSFNWDQRAFPGQKQLLVESDEENQTNPFQSQSSTKIVFVTPGHLVCPLNIGSSLLSAPHVSSSNAIRVNPSTCHSSSSRCRPREQNGERNNYRVFFDPLIIASKPLHPSLVPTNSTPLSTQMRPKSRQASVPSTRHPRPQTALPPPSTPIPVQSHEPTTNLPPDDPVVQPSPPETKAIPLVTPAETTSPSVARARLRSGVSVRSAIPLTGQIARCRSAIDLSSSRAPKKSSSRCLIIADEEHRIESWYHQYPFVLADELLLVLRSKASSSSSTCSVSAYFIDHVRSSHSHSTKKRSLQGTPFDIDADWTKFDRLLISDTIYEQIRIHLRSIVKQWRSKGHDIDISSINHQQDLKTQLRDLS